MCYAILNYTVKLLVHHPQTCLDTLQALWVVIFQTLKIEWKHNKILSGKGVVGHITSEGIYGHQGSHTLAKIKSLPFTDILTCIPTNVS